MRTGSTWLMMRRSLIVRHRPVSGAERARSIRSHDRPGELALGPVAQRDVVAVGGHDRRGVRVGAEPGARRGPPRWRRAGRDACGAASRGRRPRPRSSRPRTPRGPAGRRGRVPRARRGCRGSARGRVRAAPTPSSASPRRRPSAGSRRRPPPSRPRPRPRRVASTAARISSAVVTRTSSTPVGGSTVPGPRIRRTRAPRAERLGRDRGAHLPARAVPDEADGVDRLVGGTRRHDDRAARRGPAPPDARPRARRRDLLGLGAAAPCPCPRARAGRRPGRRSGRPRALERRDVRAASPGASHIPVCIAGATTSGPVALEEGRGQQVVGEAVRELGQQVRGRRRDHREVGLVREPDVQHLAGPFPERGVRRAARSARRTCRARRTAWPPRSARPSPRRPRPSGAARASAALYAAMPPVTPSSTRRPRERSLLVLDGLLGALVRRSSPRRSPRGRSRAACC